MESKNKQGVLQNREHHALSDEDMLEIMNTVASSTECTGLIQTPPSNDEEAESYTDIYSIPQPENKKHNDLQHE